MAATLPRITARVDSDTQALLAKAAALSGISSINSFVLNAAIEKAKSVIERDEKIRLSDRDTKMFLEALDRDNVIHPKLKEASEKYDVLNQ